MTVMPSSSDVADKAVSTEDVSSGMEVARLEAVLATLVETKVEAMKASSSIGPIASRRVGSAPPSPRRPRLTSSSTISSSQNHQQHYHHHHHHYQQQHHQQHHHNQHRHDKRGRHGHKHRRHGSAPCGDYIEHPITHHHKQKHGKDRQKSIDSPNSGKKHQRHSKSPHVLTRDVHPGIDSRFELLGIDSEQDLAFINFERSREALSQNSEYQKLHRSACYISHSSTHLKSHYDEEDYLTFDFADEPNDEELMKGLAVRAGQCANIDSRERFHRPRRKRRRTRCEKNLVDIEGLEVDDLPPRARWTIVATACLLLAMSLLLVGVTLRMAPIIDEMGDGRRASVCKKGSISRPRRASSARRRDSIRPARTITETTSRLSATSVEMALSVEKKEPREVEIARRRHRRITTLLLATFVFILAASVFAVLVTLTHSSFHKPPMGSKELADHRANENLMKQNKTVFRKENEELLNSLNRDSSITENITSLSY